MDPASHISDKLSTAYDLTGKVVLLRWLSVQVNKKFGTLGKHTFANDEERKKGKEARDLSELLECLAFLINEEPLRLVIDRAIDGSDALAADKQHKIADDSANRMSRLSRHFENKRPTSLALLQRYIDAVQKCGTPNGFFENEMSALVSRANGLVDNSFTAL